MRKFLKIFLPIFTLLAGVAICVSLIMNRTPPKRSQMTAKAPLVEVVVVNPTDESIRVTTRGTVVAAKEISLKAEVSGRTEGLSRSFVEGGRFGKGETILRVDARNYKNDLRQAEAQRAQAQAELEIEEGRQAVAKKEWELFADEVSQEEINRNLALRQPQWDQAQSKLLAAESAVDKAMIDLQRTTVRSPFNAIVVTKDVDDGQYITTQTEIATLVGTDEYWIQVSLPVSKLNKLRIPDLSKKGANAVVSHEGSHGIVTRKIGFLSRLLGDLDPEGRLARLVVSVPDPLNLKKKLKDRGLPLLLGAYVQVEIDGETLEGVYRVPDKAVREGDRVWVLSNEEQLEIRSIEIAWSYADEVLVSKGLNPGDRVITSPISNAMPGMTLRTENTLRKTSSDSPPASQPASEKHRGSL